MIPDAVRVRLAPRYDGREGIASYLGDGLSGLHWLADHRRDARARGEALSRWILRGRWCADEFGQMWTIGEGAPADLPTDARLPDVMTEAEADAAFPARRTMGVRMIPAPYSSCPRCHRGWDLSTAHDAVWREDGAELHAYHGACWAFEIHDRARGEIDGVLRDAGYPASVRVRAIPNEYWRSPGHAPWFLIEAPFGTLRAGWRKHVISIDWSDADGLEGVDGKALFASEDVTKERSLVHAWGTAKAAEYLRRLREAAR